MDPASVIVVLAIHLICTGGLLALFARQMPPRCGLGPWACGLMLFGGAYVVRLVLGSTVPVWQAVPTDTAMVTAALLFIVGLRQFVGSPAVPWRPALLLLGGFAAAETAVMVVWGSHGRHVVLNLGLGLMYLWLGTAAARQAGASQAPLRQPLHFLAGLMLLLAVLTLVRGLNVWRNGLDVVLGGSYAKLYYGYASLAAVLLAMGLMWMVFTRLSSQLADLATRDALTRVLNRTGLDDALRRHFGSRLAAPLAVLLLDLDHFKRINDELGHATGDRLLRAVADTLATHLRPSDIVARVGGEEFIVCSPAGESGGALALAERLRSAVAGLVVDAATPGLRCTVSIGVMPACPDLPAWDSALGAADRALYAAKAAGRDRVVLA